MKTIAEVALAPRDREAITAARFGVEMANDVVISTLVLPAEEWENGAYRVLPIHDEVDRGGAAA